MLKISIFSNFVLVICFVFSFHNFSSLFNHIFHFFSLVVLFDSLSLSLCPSVWLCANLSIPVSYKNVLSFNQVCVDIHTYEGLLIFFTVTIDPIDNYLFNHLFLVSLSLYLCTYVSICANLSRFLPLTSIQFVFSFLIIWLNNEQKQVIKWQKKNFLNYRLHDEQKRNPKKSVFFSISLFEFLR